MNVTLTMMPSYCNSGMPILGASLDSTTISFGYDNVNRLTSVSNGDGGESYTYDDVGNRTSSHLASSYGYQSGQFNQLISATTPSQTLAYSYDANGNMTRKADGSNLWQYTWDHDNRLTEAAARRTKVRYRYDALGRRVQRYTVGNAENTKFTHDGQDVLVDDNFGTLTKYVNGEGIDNKLRATTGSTPSYFLADHLGSTNGFANSSGSLTASNIYDSFGNPTNATFPSRYQFTGREFDSVAKMQFSRARFYDPAIGRFISEDPIGFDGGDVNLYGYVGNRPLQNRDPDGLFPLSSYSGLKNLPYARDIFGDGGYLSGPTIEELLSAKERAKRQCKTSWGQRFWNDFRTTNEALPGFGAPAIIPGIGLTSITSSATAGALGTLSPLQYALAGFKGASLGGVAAASAANVALVTASYEVGVAGGSAVNATFGFTDYCPCGQ